MKAELIATVILEIYSNGKLKEGSKRLEYDDFLQMVYMAKAEIIADLYRQDRLLGYMPVLNSMLKPYPLSIKEDEYGRKVADLPEGVTTLPDNMGVYTVTPLGGDNACDQIFPSLPGSESMICRDDSGQSFYINYGQQIRFYNLPDCIKNVEATLIVNDEKTDIPDDISFKIAKNILTVVLRTIAIPIDKTSDQNPNIDDTLKTKLSAAQLNA